VDPSPETSLVALQSLNLASDILEPRGFVDWEASPWISEHLTGLVLPIQVGPHRLLVSWGGTVAVRLFEDGQVRTRGRTGLMGSVLCATRTGACTTIRGFHGDRTVDYTVTEGLDELRLEGDTGRFRSKYLVRFRADEVALAGDHGEFDSNYAARFQPGEVHLKGLRAGELVDCRVFRDGDSLYLEGVYQGGALGPGPASGRDRMGPEGPPAGRTSSSGRAPGAAHPRVQGECSRTRRSSLRHPRN